MGERQAPIFAELLKRVRSEAGLTQEELAEAATIGVRTVSDLERGVSVTARKETARLLADALGLTGAERATFEAAARGRTWLGSTERRAHGLPAPLTSFLGRDQDLAEVHALIGQHRLVTLTGAGGTGKTRLAVEAARRAAGGFADGVWLASLAGIEASGLVVPSVMEALGVRQDSQVAAVAALQFRLQQAELLLVLDNCEHVLPACASLVEALLPAASGLRVLATSREPLGVPGEVTQLVSPLALPEPGAEAAGAPAPAVQLFLERGTAARGAGTAPVPTAVATRICQELDGLPLAIELAAAWTRSLATEEIEEHLADKFRFLRQTRPGGDVRHQTLKAAIDWSYDLLTADEQRTFGELSVFAGGFTARQAAAVCADGDITQVIDVIDRLVSKSLIETETADGQTRYRLLATIRDYAADRLAESGHIARIRAGHAIAFLDLAREQGPLPVLAREQDNFRAALDWSLTEGTPTGPQLAATLANFWLARGMLEEGCGWLERAIPAAIGHAEVHANLLRLQAELLGLSGDLERSLLSLSEASRIAGAAGLAELQARVRCPLVVTTAMDSKSVPMTDALRLCREAAELLESSGDNDGAADAWFHAGIVCYYLGQSPAEEEAFTRALHHALRSGNIHLQLEIRMWLAIITWMLWIPVDAAIGRVEQLMADISGEQWAEAEMLQQLACLFAYAGRFDDARAARARGLSMLAGFGARSTLAVVSIHGGLIELIAGDPAAAERELRTGHDMLGAMSSWRYRAWSSSLLAEALYQQNHLDEAMAMAVQAREQAPVDDVEPQARCRAVQAKILARRGQLNSARTYADEAVAIIEPTSKVGALAELLAARAEVARMAAMPAEAAADLRRAMEIYQQKGAPPLADRVGKLIAELTAAASQS